MARPAACFGNERQTDELRGTTTSFRAVWRRRWIVITTACTVLGVIASAFTSLPPRLIYNATASAPTGFYWVHAKGSIRVGDMVLATAPPSFQKFVVERRYLPPDVSLIKRIVATKGDHACARNSTISINGKAVLEVRSSDSLGRPMPVWQGCRTLRHGEFFTAMSDVDNSLDSRYFGPIKSNLIIGRLTPVWTSSASSTRTSEVKAAQLARPSIDGSSTEPDAEFGRTR